MKKELSQSGLGVWLSLLLPFIALSVVSQLYILLPVGERLSVALGVSVSQVSGLSTIFGIFYALGMIFWGVASDKYGRRKVMLLGLGVLLLCTLLLAWERRFNSMMILRGAQGFFAASFPPVIMAWVAEYIPLNKRLAMIGYLSCAFLLAGVVGQTFGDYMIGSDLRMIMLALAFIYVVAIIVVSRLPHDQIQLSSRNRLWTMVKNLPRLVLWPRLTVLYVCALGLLCAFVSLYTLFIQAYSLRLENMGVSIDMLRVVAFFAMLLSLTALSMIHRFGQLRLLSITLFGLGMTLLTQYYALVIQSPALLLSSHFLFVAAIAYSVPSLISAVGEQAEAITAAIMENIKGSALALYTFILFVGASLGAYLPNVLSGPVLLGMLSLSLILVSLRLFWLRSRQMRPL